MSRYYSRLWYTRIRLEDRTLKTKFKANQETDGHKATKRGATPNHQEADEETIE